MSWNYRLDTPMMQLAEEVNKKYDTDAGKMLLCTYLFMVSSEEIKDKQAFFDWVEELNKSCKCESVSYVKSLILSGMRKRENFIMRGIFGII